MNPINLFYKSSCAAPKLSIWSMLLLSFSAPAQKIKLSSDKSDFSIFNNEIVCSSDIFSTGFYLSGLLTKDNKSATINTVYRILWIYEKS